MVMDLATALNKEALALEEAGATIIQFDEPAIIMNKNEFPLLEEASEAVTRGLTCKTEVCIYFRDVSGLATGLYQLPFDVIGLDFAWGPANFDLLDGFPEDKELVIGLLDARNTRLEQVDEIVAAVRRVTEHVSLDRLHLSPSCGLDFLPQAERQAEAGPACGGRPRRSGGAVLETGLGRLDTIAYTAAHLFIGAAGSNRTGVINVTKGLLTTSVGSFPKPSYLTKARTQFARGQIDQDELDQLGRKATEHWIRVQEEIGIDILVDGEMYRGDMVTYFSEHMQGFKISGLVRSYGNRYYRKPIAVGPVSSNAEMTVDWWKYAQSLTDKPIKGMLTGPYTIADWSFNEYYPSREEFVMDLAAVVHNEAMALQKAGAKYIQIDEPAISTRPDEMEMASRALGIVTDGLDAYTFTHICYGDFFAVYDQVVNLPVDNLDLEMSNSNYDLLDELAISAPPARGFPWASQTFTATWWRTKSR